MSRYQYPFTIDNGVGEQVTFLGRVAGARGERMEGENNVSPGAGAAMHVHHHQDETFTVRQGTLAYQRLGEAPSFAGPGATVTFRAGEPHKFWNAGSDQLICSSWVEPADNVEFFLSALFDSQKRAGSMRPGLFDIAYLARRYRSEFSMYAIPAAVQRVLFPMVVAVGHALGKYARYADAPEPVVRPLS